MNNFGRFAVLALLFALIGSAHADTRIVVVDLVKVIKGYYKSDIIFNQLNDEEKEFERSFQEMGTDLQKEGAEYDALLREVQDNTNSAAARQAKGEQAELKKQIIVRIQETMEKKRTDFVHNFQAERAVKEQQLVEDVSKAVADYAAAKGLDLVMDKSGGSVTTGAPLLVFVGPTVPDITNDIIARINIGAPRTAMVNPAQHSLVGR
jgi:Skp family chaperone for outer membrane proteins